MDGNGRWAKKRGLPRVAGHRKGVETVREIVEACAEIGVKYLTLYTFSTENWKRPRHEVLTLMGLLKEYIKRELENMRANNLRFRPIGRIDQLDRSVQRELQRAVEGTADCTGTLVQIALNYSGRQELTEVARSAAAAASAGEVESDAIDDARATNDPEMCR